MSYGPAEMEIAEKFARENIVELANEILIWRNNGLLHDGTGGKVRELAALMPPTDRRITLAENMVSWLCVELIASHK